MPFYGSVQLSLCNGRSSGISSMLLRLCWETQQTFLQPHVDVSSWRHWPTCATWLGYRYRLMLPEVTRTLAENTKLEKNRSIRIRREQLSVSTTCKHSLFGGCLAFASPLHLLSFSFAPKQVKLTHNHLFFQNGQIDIPEVKLTWGYTVTIKCSRFFWAVYIWIGYAIPSH